MEENIVYGQNGLESQTERLSVKDCIIQAQTHLIAAVERLTEDSENKENKNTEYALKLKKVVLILNNTKNEMFGVKQKQAVKGSASTAPVNEVIID